MKKLILNLRGCHHLRRVGIFLVMLALIVGMPGCEPTSCGSVLQYALNVFSTLGGTVTVVSDGTSPYLEGVVVTLVAIPDVGYSFVQWTGDVNDVEDVTSPTITITMNTARSVTANFEAMSYDLVVDSTDGGEVTMPGEGTFGYDAGTVVDLLAAPASGYCFIKWTGTVGAIADIYAAETTITMNGDYSITANFEEIPPGQFSLTILSIDGGSVTTPGEGTFIYDAGTMVDLVANAAGGYRFVNWTGTVSAIADVYAAETTITMSDSFSITANFIAQYQLTIDSTDGGEVMVPGEGTFTYDAGMVVDLLAEADAGYQLINWTGNVSTIDNVNTAITTITMNDNYVITANFAIPIWDWYDLDDIRDNLGSNCVLMNDLNSASGGYEELASPIANGGKGWQPIGPTDEGTRFTGSFDGQGYEICDLFINRPGESNVGLFGVVGGGAIIENIDLMNITVTGYMGVSGLAGVNDYGTISNIYSTGSVAGGWQVGSLAGHNYGNISDSYSTGSVTGWWCVGGLAGQNSGNVSNSHSTGNVIGSWWVGGLAGYNGGSVIGSYSTGNVTGWWYVGGLVGDSHEGNVSNSHSTGNVIGGWWVGGLAGHNSGNVGDSYATGSVTGGWWVGGLAGHNNGNVNDCHFTGSVTGGWCVGGLAGHNSGDVGSCYSTGSVTGNGWVGGLVGKNENTIGNSYSTGSVTGNTHVGGLMGQNNGSVNNVHSTGSVNGNAHVGGLVGRNEGPVSNSYASGSVNGNTHVGGLVGKNEDTVNNCYCSGRVTGNIHVGGLVGQNEGTVSDCYCAGRVSGKSHVGGLVGQNEGSVGDCYSSGKVTGKSHVGGLVGQNRDNVSNSFWDIQTSEQATSSGGTGKTTTEMMDITTFSSVGWDIVTVGDPGERNLAYIWNIVDDITYPFVSWQPG